MKKITLLIILVFFNQAVFSQDKNYELHVGNVISDPSSFKSYDYRKILPPINDTKNKIEIRLVANYWYRAIANLVLSLNSQWSAQYFLYESDGDTTISRQLKDISQLDTIFSRLLLNNVFSLQDQDSIATVDYIYDSKNNKFVGQVGAGTGDGVCYYIEFKIADKLRCYCYCNPRFYLETYPSSNELRCFVNILNIFNELFEI